jgi:DMSO/TMAO reductase YedYZ molybdopterin-dependent catalytic subunit
VGSRLPPGQIRTERFPLVGERTPSADLASDPTAWTLEITGRVRKPVRFDLEEYVSRANHQFASDVHCVTSWSRFDMKWGGVPLAELLDEAGVAADARFVSYESYSPRDHHTSLPLDVAVGESWLVHEADGEALSTEHGGPVRVVTPGRYFYKSAKWIKRIVVLVEDRLGWWETNSSYHNNGDPWAGDERFTSGSVRPEQLRRFLQAPTYDKYRGRVLLGLDLRRWEPRSRDLRRLYLKNCDLREVDLSGVDMRESNLSLSDLRGSNLAGADLSGSDLEGANFAGADLSAANLRNTALSAARFAGDGLEAHVSGSRFGGCWGLTETEEGFLAERGVEIAPAH